ncbi:MAG: hypothetical protein HY595_02595, partial [Candidatus Omnitrophica bacterium]|nr:hypothetical protein [Candidatus Omnitrophota bacterium]
QLEQAAMERWKKLIVTTELNNLLRGDSPVVPIEGGTMMSLHVLYTTVMEWRRRVTPGLDLQGSDDEWLNGLDEFVLRVSTYMGQVMKAEKQDSPTTEDSNFIWHRLDAMLSAYHLKLRRALENNDTNTFKSLLAELTIQERNSAVSASQRMSQPTATFEAAYKQFKRGEDWRAVHPWLIEIVRFLPRFLVVPLVSLSLYGPTSPAGVSTWTQVAAALSGVDSGWVWLFLGGVLIYALGAGLSLSRREGVRQASRWTRIVGAGVVVVSGLPLVLHPYLVVALLGVGLVSLALLEAFWTLWPAPGGRGTGLTRFGVGSGHSMLWQTLRFLSRLPSSSGGAGGIIAYWLLHLSFWGLGVWAGVSVLGEWFETAFPQPYGLFKVIVGSAVFMLLTLYQMHYGIWVLLIGIASAFWLFLWHATTGIAAISLVTGQPWIMVLAGLLAAVGWWKRHKRAKEDAQLKQADNDSKKTATVFVGANLLASPVLSCSSCSVNDVVTQLMKGWEELSALKADGLRAIRQEHRVAFEHFGNEASAVRHWLTAVHEAEQQAKVGLWDLEQLDNINSLFPKELKVTTLEGYTAEDVKRGYRIRNWIVSMDPEQNTAQDTAASLATYARALRDATLGEKHAFLLTANVIANKWNEKPVNAGAELAQREKLARLLRHLSGATAYAVKNETAIPAKGIAMEGAMEAMGAKMADIAQMVVWDRNTHVSDVEEAVRDLRRFRADPEAVVMIAGRSTTNTLLPTGAASQLIEEASSLSYFEAINNVLGGDRGEPVATGWGTHMRVLKNETLQAMSHTDYPVSFLSRQGQGAPSSLGGWMDRWVSQAFGSGGAVPNAVGISEDLWAAIQMARELIALGRRPKFFVSRAMWHKVRETKTQKAWFSAFPRWSHGNKQTMADLTMQRLWEFGPWSVFSRDIRGNSGTFYLGSTLFLLSILITPGLIMLDLQPFVGMMLVFWLAGFVFNQILTIHGLLTYLRSAGFRPAMAVAGAIGGLALGLMLPGLGVSLTGGQLLGVGMIGGLIGGFIIGIGKWLNSRFRDMLLFAPQLAIHAWAQLPRASLVFRPSGGEDKALTSLQDLWEPPDPKSYRPARVFAGIGGGLALGLALHMGISLAGWHFLALGLIGGLIGEFSHYYRTPNLRGVMMFGLAMTVFNLYIFIIGLDLLNALLLFPSLMFSVGLFIGPMVMNVSPARPLVREWMDSLVKIAGVVLGFVPVGVVLWAAWQPGGVGLAHGVVVALLLAAPLVIGGWYFHDKSKRESRVDSSLTRVVSQLGRGYWIGVFTSWIFLLPSTEQLLVSYLGGRALVPFDPILQGLLAVMAAATVLVMIGHAVSRAVASGLVHNFARMMAGRLSSGSFTSSDAYIHALADQFYTFISQGAHAYARQTLDKIKSLLQQVLRNAQQQLQAAQTNAGHTRQRLTQLESQARDLEAQHAAEV